MTRSDPVREKHKVSMAVEVLQSSGRLRMSALGYSMLPNLWPGDVLNIHAGPSQPIAAGEVILFVREGRLFAHRVLRRENLSGKEVLIARGDSMTDEDMVSPHEVLGKVVAVERDGRHISVPHCTPLSRSFGLALGWSRLRGLVLRLRQERSTAGNAETAQPGTKLSASSKPRSAQQKSGDRGSQGAPATRLQTGEGTR